MKPKAKTLIEKMGFVDKDMLNSDHDRIVQWIDKNSDEIMMDILLPIKFQTNSDEDNYFKSTVEQSYKNHIEFPTQKWKNKIEKELNNSIIEMNLKPHYIPNPEKKIRSFLSYDICFDQNKHDKLTHSLEKLKTIVPFDLETQIILYKQEMKRLRLLKKHKKGNINFESNIWELPIKSGYFVIGFIDLSRTVNFEVENMIVFNTKNLEFIRDNNKIKYPTLERSKHQFKCYFEAKTSIPSIGELMRQLQFYKTYISDDNEKNIHKIGVVSYPNPETQRIVESQGFFWIDYPGEKPKTKSNGQRTLC